MLKKIAFLAILAVGSITFLGDTNAKGVSVTEPKPQTEPVTVAEPTPSASAWGLFNPETGAVLSGENTKIKKPIASITKLFTAYTVLQSDKKDVPFNITFSDVYTEGRAGKITYGEKMTPYELLFPLLIESSNDAAEAIHRNLGKDFSSTIATLEKTLPLTDTEIKDASGLGSKNISTVYDLALFYAHLRRTHPHILDITALKTYVGPYAGYINNDPASQLKNFAGGKHGYTDEAGRTFVGTFTLEGTHEEIGIVLLGSKDILSDVKDILAYEESIMKRSDIMTK